MQLFYQIIVSLRKRSSYRYGLSSNNRLSLHPAAKHLQLPRQFQDPKVGSHSIQGWRALHLETIVNKSSCV